MCSQSDTSFWDDINDYEAEVVSVLTHDNALTRRIERIRRKNKKTICDAGCGPGNLFRRFHSFKTIYAVDYSSNMLDVARQRNKGRGNVHYILSTIDDYTLPEKVDISFAISSIMPGSLSSFYAAIDNIVKNTKNSGLIFLVVPSFEARVFSILLDADRMFSKGNPVHQIADKVNTIERRINFGALGYFVSRSGLIQKHWLEEDLRYRLGRYNFYRIEIEKLQIDWELQMKSKSNAGFPSYWLWLVVIDV